MNGQGGTTAIESIAPAHLIDKQLDAAWTQVSYIHEQLDRLAQRLIPVINPAVTRQNDRGIPLVVARMTTSSPLAESIHRLGVMAGNANDKLEVLIHQLDL